MKKKKWVNKNLIKSTFQKVKTDINQNSLIFFNISNDIDEQQIACDQLEKVENMQKNNKKKSKKIWSILFLILNIALISLVFYNFAHEQGGIQPLNTLFENSPNWIYLFIAFGIYLLTVLLNSFKFLILIFHRTKKIRFNFSLKMGVIGRYYDLVTPLGSGGQPFEIYNLRKNGYSGETATAIPLAKYMFWQISFLILSLYVLIFKGSLSNSLIVTILAWIGLSICLALFLFVFFMSTTKKWGASLVVKILKLLHKMKIIKDYRKTLRKVLKFVKQYQICIKAFAKNPVVVISMTLITMASLITNALIAYYVYISFVDVPIVNAYDIICMCFMCELASSFFPLPGGSGAQELSFNALLGTLFTEGTLFWGVLIWRILTYYIYILHGAIVLVIDFIISKAKNHRNIDIICKDRINKK